MASPDSVLKSLLRPAIHTNLQSIPTNWVLVSMIRPRDIASLLSWWRCRVGSPMDTAPSEVTTDAGELTEMRRNQPRCWLIKTFVLAMTVVIAIQTAPRQYQWTHAAKDLVAPIAKRLGLWQGEWSLFAPDPVLNNAWLSAEVYAPSGELTMWNSTYWGAASGMQKFRDFRMMNLGNRLHNRESAAQEDFADFIARQMISPTARFIPNATEHQTDNSTSEGQDAGASVWRLKLYRSQLKMTLPADGSLPARDDTIWISSSVNLVNREYLP